MSHDPYRNLSLNDAIKIANELGVPVAKNNKGEVGFWFHEHYVRASQSRKDAPRIVVCKLRQLEKARRKAS